MKFLIKSTAISVALIFTSTDAFNTPVVGSVGSSFKNNDNRIKSTAVFGYIPDGFTAESYKKFKAEEQKKQQQKSLDRVGPRGFKSRSFQSFQEAMERGEAEHLMPVFNAKEKLKSGELKMQDIPYMQRGGSWDNSDVKGANQKRWLNSDKSYAEGGYGRDFSGFGWTGIRSKSGPSAGEVTVKSGLGKKYKVPNINDNPKKFFGLF